MTAPTPSPADLLKGTTPGPWVHRTEFGEYILHGTAVLAECRYPGPANGSKNIGERQANARLIAAAPDLAKRLAEAEASLNNYRECWRRQFLGEPPW